MERIRRQDSGAYRVSVATHDEDGAAATAAAPVTVTISDGAGELVWSAEAEVASGGLLVQVPVEELTLLDTYSCLWSEPQAPSEPPEEPGEGENAPVVPQGRSWRSWIDLCGGYLFEVAELREWESAYSDPARYPAAKVRAARTAAEMRFEAAAGTAFVPRGARASLRGNGQNRMVLPHVAIRGIYALSIDGTPLTAEELAGLTLREWGALDRAAGWPYGAKIDVHYEHGLDFPPAPVSQAALLLAPEYLTRKALASRALSEVNELGSFRLGVAGPTRATGIPEVDRVAADYGRNARMVT